MTIAPVMVHAQRSASSYAVSRLGVRAVHALTSSTEGKVSALVEHPVSISPDVFGLKPVVPGISILTGSAADLAGFIREHHNWPIELAPPLRKKLNLAVPYVRADVARTTRNLNGSGTYIGVVDTGLDLFHQDFLLTNGNTRVAWLLDFAQQSREGDARDKKYGGRVYDRAQIDAYLKQAERGKSALDDRDGHGTHVMGLAASNGGADSQYTGVAPGADLIVVRAARGEEGAFTEADIVAGVKFVFDMAKTDGKPAVVNLSLGSQFGPHDGTSTFEQALSELAKGPGRSIVVAASNEGADAVHTNLYVSKGAQFRVPIRLEGPQEKQLKYSNAQVFVWINWRKDSNVSVGIENNEGTSWLDPVGPKNVRDATLGDVRVLIANDVDDESLIPRGTHGAIVTWSGPLNAGNYSLVLEGEGVAEFYVQGGGDASEGAAAPFFAQGSLTEGSIGIPASAPGLIAIGSVGVRTEFTNSQKKQLRLLAPCVNVRCEYSSAGPTARGDLKPDVLAPGNYVISSLSRNLFEKAQNSSLAMQIVDSEHLALAGTSMSTAFGTGAASILFQLNPTLTQEQIRVAFIAGARPTSDDATQPNDDMGKGGGILDVEGAIKAITTQPNSSNATQLQMRLGASYLAADGSIPVWAYVLARDPSGSPANANSDLKLEVLNANVFVPLEHVGVGLYRFALLASKENQGSEAIIRVFQSSEGSLRVERTLSIGADYFDARFGLKPSGGSCSLIHVLPRDSKNKNSYAFTLVIAWFVIQCVRHRYGTPRA